MASKKQDPTVAGIIKARKGVKIIIRGKKIPKATILKTIRTWRPHY